MEDTQRRSSAEGALDRSKLPSLAFLSPELAALSAKMTAEGVYSYTNHEEMWARRYKHLLQRGYRLRQRYTPGWRPSWLGTNIDPEFCEDAVVLQGPFVIDATTPDGTLVAIKSIPITSQELEIAQYLNSIDREDKHCVSIIDDFPDPMDPGLHLMVMPYLRPFNDPEFAMVGDVIEFVRQMLEGLAFLHSHRIAHRDIAALNIMMDGRPLYPNGHHPVNPGLSQDILVELTPRLRMDYPVDYFYIDFGLSARFAPEDSPYVVGDVGRDAEVPELSFNKHYNACKADIYALGNLFDKEFHQQYHDTEFLMPLIECMKQEAPDLRPSADQLVRMFQPIREMHYPAKARWRLSPKTESTSERLINDAIAAARDGFRRFVG
ncbi:kinase-like domain-containing protein [Trametes elegans]|nr:kinase-like domain-containing protein [Trametes elegans]